MTKYLRLMRVHHYIKNLLIFLPLFFSKRLFEIDLLLNSIFAFISFSFISSCVYIINDIKDLENDRKHSVKSKRPIASGEVSIRSAIILFFILFLVAIIINTAILKGNLLCYSCIILYFIANLLYSFGLKNIPILDVMILALGFVLRLIFGSAVTNIELSNWFYLTMILGSFYLGFGKRRNELLREGNEKRKVLQKYTLGFLDKNMYMCLSLTLMFYSLWTIDNSTKSNLYTMWTIPLLVITCLKYNLNIEKESDGDPTEIILKDKVLIVMIGVYSLTMFAILYGMGY